MSTTLYVAWWNVENLFDHKDAPRSDKLQRVLQNDLKNWTVTIRDQKISQLASVIAQMNNGAGPDLLGVCEIENETVVQLLVDKVNTLLPAARSYKIVHADTGDERGIDVAFIYDTTLLEVPAPLSDSVFFHVVMRRNATREIVQVTFTTKTATPRTWAVFGNHWPSRRGGAEASAGYRAIAGETLAYFHQRVLEVHGPATPVLVMGDFNDEPFNTSLDTHALSRRQRELVVNGDNPYLWNLAYPLLGSPDGTFYFENQPNMLDQVLVNKNMAKATSPIKADSAAVHIVRFPGMTSTGRYKSPIPFKGLGDTTANPAGFSDHFPIATTVTLS
ncbi:endonuclease/exonuclease/phosphatase family protein [Nocardia abscessus]|uniref:endonuclease/exonuclease/phosphatase family protein n=1 Tax=Nocardia abscessus TaxID=120957 RepID=UPI001895172A|nr:endonuclease/exonuclease/phosphatase family protein [Nocardia abscessus]MBF6339833.1 endonuclease/exonuclease/phosphatase family protein [Nocardia abscessus]